MTAYTQTQSTSQYCFDSEDIKDIAYAIESRKLLVLDTAAYKQTIKVLRLEVSNIQEINKRLTYLNSKSSSYVSVLEGDVRSLMDERVVLANEISSLQKKNKLLKKAIPIGIAIGAGVVLLLK